MQNQVAHPETDGVDAALADYMRRVDAGEQIDRDSFIAEYPQFADELGRFFESAEVVERMAGPPLASTVKNGAKSAETHVSSIGDSVSENPSRQTQIAQNDSLPEVFGRYRIEKQLGRGAMGAVYLAHDTQLDRRVALKTPTFDTTADPEMVERFYREARAAANLRHAGICPIFDVGEIDGTHYISMAYIEGKPLSSLVNVKQPLPIRTAASLVRKLAIALDHAHGEGVIHRDLKPANIMIDKQRQPLVMDFGLARQTGKQEQTRLTQDGMILGTPAYMSPEQIEGHLETGKQSDVYSLGVILYELLTGDLPFQGTVAAVIGQIMTQNAPSPSSERSDVDAGLDAICRRMMAKKAADRYAGMQEVAAALTDYLKNQTSGERKSTATITTDDGLAAFLATASEEEFPVIPPRREATLTQLIAPWNKLPAKTKVAATAVIAGLLLMFSVIVMFSTPNGTVGVEVIGNEDIDVLIDDKSIKFIDKQWSDDREAGKHRLALKIGGKQLEFDEKSKQFKLTDGSFAVNIAGVAISGGMFEVLRGENIAIRLEVIQPPQGDGSDKLPDDGPVPQLVTKFDHKADRTKESYTALLSPDAARVAYRMEYNDPLQMFEAVSRKQIALPQEMQNAYSIDDNADGSLLATGHPDGTVRVWNSQTLKPVGQPFVTTAGFFVRWVSLSDDGKTLLALPSGQPPSFYAWDVQSREKVTDPFFPKIETTAKGIHVAASADDLLLALACYEKGSPHLVQLWDVKTGQPRETRFVPDAGNLGTIFDIALTPRGDRLAVANKEGNCFVFDTATGKEIMTAPHGGRVSSVQFSSNGRQLAVCGGPADSEDMHLWDLETKEELVRWKLPVYEEAYRTERFGAWAGHLSYSRDGSHLLTAGVNTPVCVWRLLRSNTSAATDVTENEVEEMADD